MLVHCGAGVSRSACLVMMCEWRCAPPAASVLWECVRCACKRLQLPCAPRTSAVDGTLPAVPCLADTLLLAGTSRCRPDALTAVERAAEP